MPRRANSEPRSSEIRELCDSSPRVFVEHPLRKSSGLRAAGGVRMKKSFQLKSLESDEEISTQKSPLKGK